MNHQPDDLLTIGGFAYIAQLSIKALRLYEQQGMLRPRYVDRDSGYRYYHIAQLPTARLIALLRRINMPLATIRQVLAVPPMQAEALVAEYWRMREQQMEQGRMVVRHLQAILRQEEHPMALDVQVKTIDSQPVLSQSYRVQVAQLDQTIHDGIQALYTLAAQQGYSVGGAPFGIYHGPINHEDDGPLEVCVPVEKRPATQPHPAEREVSGGSVAYVLLEGAQCDFPEILKGYDALYSWVNQHGYGVSEPPREIWHRPPGSDMQIEVALQFRQTAAGGGDNDPLSPI